MKKVKTIRYGVLHKIVNCVDCGWMEEDYTIARKCGRKHCHNTGHRVNIETGTSFDYVKQ